MDQDEWKAEKSNEPEFVTKSDKWLVLLLGNNLQTATLRMFAYEMALAAIAATLAYLAT